MLKSDGMSRETFMAIWKEEILRTGDASGRARLVFELGRMNVRDFRRADPLVVAIGERRESPLMLFPLPDSMEQDHVRDGLRERLGELAADEVYVIVTLAAGEIEGVPHYLLGVWGETRRGDEVAWLQPFRWVGDRLEEAEALEAPDPRATVLGRTLRGLLPPRH